MTNNGNIWELVFSLAWGLTGWYLPKYLLMMWYAQSILDKDDSIIVQIVNNHAVLDFLYNQPLVDPPTIPSNFLIFTTVWLPIIMALGAILRLHKKETAYRVVNLRTTVCAWATAIGTSEGLTQMFKMYVQRRRPNFVELCGFEGGQCTNSDARIIEASLSFPSGHSSLTACGMTFLTLALASQFLSSSSLSPFRKRWITPLVALTAFTYTIFVGTSRIVDHWHHPSDVLAGWLLGSLCSAGAFHVWYPYLWHEHVGTPWSVLLKQDLVAAPSSGSLLPLSAIPKEGSFQE